MNSTISGALGNYFSLAAIFRTFVLAWVGVSMLIGVLLQGA